MFTRCRAYAAHAWKRMPGEIDAEARAGRLSLFDVLREIRLSGAGPLVFPEEVKAAQEEKLQEENDRSFGMFFEMALKQQEAAGNGK